MSTFQLKKAEVLSISPGVECKYPCATSAFLFPLFPSIFLCLFVSLSLPLPLSVLVYASDFVERQEQPEGFLLHKTSLLMSSIITSNAAQCVFLTHDLLPENVIEEIQIYQ